MLSARRHTGRTSTIRERSGRHATTMPPTSCQPMQFMTFPLGAAKRWPKMQIRLWMPLLEGGRLAPSSPSARVSPCPFMEPRISPGLSLAVRGPTATPSRRLPQTCRSREPVVFSGSPTLETSPHRQSAPLAIAHRNWDRCARRTTRT